MGKSDNSLPYIMIGCIFYTFGLKWCCEYAKFWTTPKRKDDREGPNRRQLLYCCERLFSTHPIEGSMKLIATAIGLVSTMVGGLPDDMIISPKVIHATVYLFFALSGLVDVLRFYFPRNITNGLANLALAQSFFVEGFLFTWAVSFDFMINTILAIIVWTTAAAIGLELVWPDLKLLRGFTTLLHGGWLVLMVRPYPSTVFSLQGMVLALSWHIAAAFLTSLCIIAAIRSHAPKIVTDEPPEIPIYDYCHEPHHIM